MANQHTINFISKQIRESRIEYKMLLRELHKDINSYLYITMYFVPVHGYQDQTKKG